MEWRELLNNCGILHPGGEVLTQKMIDSAGIRSGKALDLACGEGSGCEQLILKGFEAFGVDSDPLFVTESKVKDAVIVCSDAKHIPFEASYFDLVMCECSLSVFDDRESVLKEVFRVLKTGGKFIFSDLYSKELTSVFALEGWKHLTESAGFVITEIYLADDEWKSLIARMIWDGLNMKELSSCILPDVAPKDISYFYAVSEKV